MHANAPPETRPEQAAPPPASRPAASRLPALAAVPGVTWLLLFVLGPLLLVAGMSVRPRGLYGGTAPGVTLAHYLRFAEPLYVGILARTTVMALLTTLGCLGLALPMAYAITRATRWRKLLLFLAVLPLWTSLLVRTYALMFLLGDSGPVNGALLAAGVLREPLTLLYTEGTVLAGLILTALPFMVLPLYASLEQLDVTLLEAAESLGATRRVRFTQIVWPLARPGVAAGALLVFVPTLGALVVPDLLGGARRLMLGSLVQAQFGAARNWPFGSAASVAVLAGIALVLLALPPAARAALLGRRTSAH